MGGSIPNSIVGTVSKVISNNESTKRNVHKRHEKHEQILLLFVLFVSFVDSIFALAPKLQLGNLCLTRSSLPYAREAGTWEREQIGKKKRPSRGVSKCIKRLQWQVLNCKSWVDIWLV